MIDLARLDDMRLHSSMACRISSFRDPGISSPSKQNTSRRAGSVLLLPSSNEIAGQRNDQQCSCPDGRPEHHADQDSHGRRELQEVGYCHVPAH